MSMPGLLEAAQFRADRYSERHTVTIPNFVKERSAAMTTMTARLHPGDLVEVKSPEEILSTLDTEGTLDHLPFMLEMMEFCGRRFQVSKRVVKTCTSGTKAGTSMRVFRADDVVLLEGLRCSGADHDGCQKACMIFWREAWLRKIVNPAVPARVPAEGKEQLQSRLKIKRHSQANVCQGSEILNATEHMPRRERFTTCLSEIREGNFSVWEMVLTIGTWLVWRTRRILLGAYGRGTNMSTPVESLNLQAGEFVEVKPMEKITETLNKAAHNRGLFFSPDMRLLCGQRQRVEKKIEKIIVDGTGEMRKLHNTVFLEGSYCGCAHGAFGGCPRREYVYWREIWLRRVPNSR